MKQQNLSLTNNYCVSLHNMSKETKIKVYSPIREISYMLNYECRVDKIQERFSYQTLLTEG